MRQTYYFDTAASFHMTGDLSRLTDVYRMETPILSKTPNGSVYLEYAGTTYFQPFEGGDGPIKLSPVVYNPVCDDVNLISWGQASDKCYLAQESSDSLSVYAKGDGKLLFVARKNSSNVFPAGYAVDFVGTEPLGDNPQYASIMAVMRKDPSKLDATLLHRRLGHVGYSTIQRMHDAKLFDGLNVGSEDLSSCLEDKCDACMKGKQVRLPFPTSNTPPQNTLHVDVCKIGYETLSGNAYMIVAIHEPTDYSFVLTSKTKDLACDFTIKIIEYIEKQTGHVVQRLRADNGGEFANHTLTEFLATKGIHAEFTIPYSPQQNGKAERLNRTLKDMARSMLADGDLPDMLWAEAISTANFLRNITMRPSKGFVPYKRFWGKDPPYASLRVFGCKVFVLIPKEKRTSKMDPVCDIGMMIGYCPNAQGYRVLLEDEDGTYHVVQSRDVVFDETKVGMRECFPKKRAREDSPVEPSIEPPSRVQIVDPDASTGGAEATPPPVRGRSGRATKPPSRLGDYLTYALMSGEEVICYYVDDADATIEPLTLAEAMASPLSDKWREALNAEYSALLANDTWTLVDCPKGVTPIPGKWVFKIKRNAMGQIESFKCRFVIKGYRQEYGTHYLETFAPVARHTTIRCVFAVAAANDWDLLHLDTNTAFLLGELKEDIYMLQPEGFVHDPTKVCKLKKSLYGLKQAPYVWHKTLHAAFAKHGFTVSLSDQSVLILRHSDVKTFAMIYVDDQIITGPNSALNAQIKDILLATFPGKDLGEAQFFVGVRLQRDRERRLLKMSQTRHIDDLVTMFQQSDSNPTPIPMGTGGLELSLEGSEPLAVKDKGNYSSLVGSLLYLSMVTRPDIAYAVGLLTRYMSNPTKHHWKAAIQVLRYLKSTRTYGLVFGNTDGLTIVGYSDSNWGADKDDSISTYGFVFKLNGAAISWRSKKQERIARSTADAEYIAASHATREVLWLNKLRFDLDINGKIVVFVDNTTALQSAVEGTLTAKNRHMAIHYRSVIESARYNEVEFERIPTTEMVADIFTKPLPKVPFEQFRTALGVRDTHM